MEMPIRAIHQIGDFSKANSFRHGPDRALISQEKPLQKLKQSFAGSPHPFVFYFVNLPGAAKHLEVGLLGEDGLRQIMPTVADQLAADRQADRGWDSITVIYTNNTGAQRYPMTPWIVAHRLGHALTRIGGMTRSDTGPAQTLREMREMVLQQFFSILENGYNLHQFGRYNSRAYAENPYRGDPKIALPLRQFMMGIGTFKSARDRQMRNDAEFWHECLAQYILTGKVAFNPPPRNLQWRVFDDNEWPRRRFQNSYATLQANDHDMQYYTNSVNDIATEMAGYYHSALDDAGGRIFVM